ncbi:MAG: response regulator [Thermoleophilia bacterium]|nr:response regulator [Thermoleophilia bacterium]
MAEPRLGHVLVVDDEDDIRAMLQIVLSIEGWSVDEASGGSEALAQCAQRAYDVVVLDERMPGLNGLQVARRLVARGFDGRLVLFSAYVDDDVRSECEELGVAVVDKVDWYALVENCRGAVATTIAS